MEREEDESQLKWFFVYFMFPYFMFPFYVLIFVLFHGCRLYGSLYQLFHKTERYHSGSFAEERLYFGGLDPACVDLDESGRLIKNGYSKECLREVDYAIFTFFGIAWVLSVIIFLYFGKILQFKHHKKLLLLVLFFARGT